MKRVKVITGWTALHRFLNDVPRPGSAGYIPRVQSVPSPYAYSPTDALFMFAGVPCFIHEVSHKRSEVWTAPAGPIYKTDKQATDAFIVRH